MKILERISYDGKAATDPEIVSWVNSTLEKAGKSGKLKSFKVIQQMDFNKILLEVDKISSTIF